MNRAAIPAAAALVLVAGLVLWVQLRGDGAAAPEGDLLPSRGPAVVPTASGERGPDAGGPLPAGSPPPASENARSALEDTAPAAAPTAVEAPLADGLEVVVVEDATGRPLPGARVSFLDGPAYYSSGREAEARELLEELLEEDDPGAPVLDHGRSFEADAQGRVTVPPGPGVLLGRSGELWNLVALPARTQAPFELRLTRSGSLRVRVVRATGEPASGVPVMLIQKRGSWADEYRYVETEGPEGLAELDHAALYVRAAAAGVWGETRARSRWFVALCLHAAETPMVELDPAALPAEPIEFVLPPMGRVELHVRAEDGSVPEEPFWTDLLIPGADDEPFPASAVNSSIPLRDTDGDGQSYYKDVGLGLEFEAWAGRKSGDTSYSALGTGPTVPGETAVIVVPVLSLIHI